MTWMYVAVILVSLVLYLRQSYSRFSRYGVKHFRTVPFLGNFAPIIFRLEHVVENISRTYNAFPEERFVGKYDFVMPSIIIRDLELVKKITIKDYEYFLNRSYSIDEKCDAVTGRTLFVLKGDDWREMRSVLNPAFTSSKMRAMVKFVLEVGDQMIKALKNKLESSKGFIDIDASDLTTRFTNDVITSCAFGIKVDSYTDQHNQFYVKGKQAATFTPKVIFQVFGFRCIPKIMRLFKIFVIPKDVQDFYKTIVMSTMQDREERHIVRPDMIHLLMEARKGTLFHDNKKSDADAGFATVEESVVGRNKINKVWTDEAVVAQAMLFFIVGLMNIAGTMSFLIRELALHPDVQEKLVREVRENDAKHDGKIDFDSLRQMTYLDMVVSEVLRLWPPVMFIDRGCTRDYNLGKANETTAEEYIIRKGEHVAIPIWAIHRDPKYFPDPLRFDPERFSERNKHHIKPFTYMPFGLGPRNCIASQFALYVVKVMAYQLLRSMELSPAAKTQMNVKLDKKVFQTINIEGGHWVRLKARN